MLRVIYFCAICNICMANKPSGKVCFYECSQQSERDLNCLSCFQDSTILSITFDFMIRIFFLITHGRSKNWVTRAIKNLQDVNVKNCSETVRVKLIFLLRYTYASCWTLGTVPLVPALSSICARCITSLYQRASWILFEIPDIYQRYARFSANLISNFAGRDGK